MFEKVNPGHPDKMADRLAGAVVDLVYERAGGLTKANPRVACEVMAGHGRVDVQIETSLGRMDLRAEDIDPLIRRLFGERVVGNVLIAPQDAHLSENQTRGLRCGDNGIFRGCPPTVGFESPAKRGTAIKQGAEKTFAPYSEQQILTSFAATMYEAFPTDGKYLINRMVYDEDPDYVVYELTCCQSCADHQDILGVYETWEYENFLSKGYYSPIESLNINPLGPWTGGIDVDCGCTNRKLGSDMGDGVTGGGLMGKDLSKADVSVNIVCYLKAVASGQTVTAMCSIGDENVTFVYADGRRETETFADIVEMARLYILTDCGGSFERFAEWGLLRPKAE